ncbi:hypothetical protein UB37_01975 [Photobacterium iliopiscarium]|nr:hypothetical protein UB37_01975 [Photobacterium iliopiscarium]
MTDNKKETDVWHVVKTKYEFFNAVISGDKRFEIRKDDRDYRVGDFLSQNELSCDGLITGRSVVHQIIYKLEATAETNSYGLLSGFCILGLSDEITRNFK